MRQYVKTFKALSDTNRLRILKMLEIKPMCVCEITTVLGLATSTVSKHLSILREAGFISDIKDGKWVDYHLKDTTDGSLSMHLLNMLHELPADDDIVQADAEKVKTVDRTQICCT